MITEKLVAELMVDSVVKLSKVIPEKYIKESNVFDYRPKLTDSIKIAGRCVYKNRVIEISTKCPANQDIRDLKNTVIHEILHAIFKLDGHTGNWKKYAKIYNQSEFTKETGEITRCYDSGKFVNNDNTEHFNYKLICPDCGYTIYKIKKSKYFDLKTGKSDFTHRGCKNKMLVCKIN